MDGVSKANGRMSVFEITPPARKWLYWILVTLE